MTNAAGRMIALAMALLLLGCIAVAAAATPTTASDKLAAMRDAQRLLRLAVLPPGAVRLTGEPAGDGGLLRMSSGHPATDALIDRHDFWRVSASFRSVVTFVRAHPSAGSRRFGSGYSEGPGIPRNEEVTFPFHHIAGRISTRLLGLTMVALRNGSTGVRVDAQDVWIVARSPSEEVPAGVHAIDIKSGYPGKPPSVTTTVTDPATVRQIVQWIDGLGIVQPGAYSCPMLGGPTVTFDFRAAFGALLARASVIDFQGTSGPCNAINFTIRGHRETPLIGGNFLLRSGVCSACALTRVIHRARAHRCRPRAERSADPARRRRHDPLGRYNPGMASTA